MHFITISGVAAGAFENDIDALSQIRELFDFLPLSNKEESPIRECADPRDRECPMLNTIIPADPLKGILIKDVSCQKHAHFLIDVSSFHRFSRW